MLRLAGEEDLPAIDELTILAYAPIQAGFVEMIGEAVAELLQGEPWEDRKRRQNRTCSPSIPSRSGCSKTATASSAFSRSGSRAGQVWATFMYRPALDHFRALGLRYAHVGTGLDDAHIPARRAYEAVGFDRKVPTVEYWLDLEASPEAQAGGSDRPGPE